MHIKPLLIHLQVNDQKAASQACVLELRIVLQQAPKFLTRLDIEQKALQSQSWKLKVIRVLAIFPFSFLLLFLRALKALSYTPSLPSPALPCFLV